MAIFPRKPKLVVPLIFLTGGFGAKFYGARMPFINKQQHIGLHLFLHH